MAERKFKTWRNPYDTGFSLCRKKEITIHSGLTVLVGCNGSGKTTLLNNIRDELRKDNIPYHMFNNLYDGGSKVASKWMAENKIDLAATAMSSSEGENINLCISELASKLRYFMVNGTIDKPYSKLAKVLGNGKEEEEVTSKERWLLLDAVDSGLSIDNVIDMKAFINDLLIPDYEKNGYTLYVVVSANEYELAHKSDCFDVMSGQYVNFKGYEDFKNFIMKSRQKKDKRYE